MNLLVVTSKVRRQAGRKMLPNRKNILWFLIENKTIWHRLARIMTVCVCDNGTMTEDE